MTDQLALLVAAKPRAELRSNIAKMWLNEIVHQPMSLAADDGAKVLVLAELTLRLIEDAGYERAALIPGGTG